jgi:SAM-dependent methyltransferase
VRRADEEGTLRERERRFDARHGVETAGRIDLASLAIENPNWVHGTVYEATDEAVFAEITRALPADLSAFTFVDFGSGKGKALLLAASLPFRRVVGVELSRELHDVAVENLARAGTAGRRCGQVVSVCGDALAFELPREPLVCYLYDPFHEAVMAPLAARIGASLRETPRPVYVAYVHPRLRRFFDGMAALELLAEGEGYAVWRAGEEQVLLTLSLSPTPEGEAKRSEAMTSQGSDSQ